MQAFTVSAAARLCGVDRRTLQHAIQAGRLPLDAQHCLSREALITAGYLEAAPQPTRQETPHETPQELMQATALLALLERLTVAITDLHEEVCSLREDLRQMPQRTPRWRRKSVPRAPQITPQTTPQEAPYPSPQILSIYDPHAAAIRIRDLRRQGLSYAMIALQLTREGIPTRYGKPWEHSSVRYVLETYGQENAP